MELTVADSGRDSAKTLVTRRGRRGSAGVVTQAPGGAPEGPKVEVGKALVAPVWAPGSFRILEKLKSLREGSRPCLLKIVFVNSGNKEE